MAIDYEEFFQWLYPFDIVSDMSRNAEYLELDQELTCLITDCKNINQNDISKYIAKLPESRRLSLIRLFRIMTGVAKTNFQIFFTWDLVKDNLINVKFIPMKNKSKLTKTFEHDLGNIFSPKTIKKFKANPENFTNTEKNIAKLLQNKQVICSFMKYFTEKGILEKINKIKKDSKLKANFLSQLIKYDKKGAVANARGAKAEEILRDKLVEFGLERKIDFNTNDVSTKELVLKRLKSEIISSPKNKQQIQKQFDKIQNKIFIKRGADLVLFLEDPAIIIQSSFYGSDTASIAAATRDENQLENELIEEANKVIAQNPILHLGLIDGVGFHSIDKKRYTGLLVSVDDYFGIRTISTKLKRLLHSTQKTLPIDFEIILFLKGKLKKQDLVKEFANFYPIPIVKVEEELEKWKKRDKFSIVQNFFSIKQERQHIIPKYALLDSLQKIAPSKKGKIRLPVIGTIDDSQIKTLKPQFSNFDDLLKNLISNMEIIQYD